MSEIEKYMTDLIGNTPLLELANFSESKELKARLLVKLEFFNRCRR